MGSRNNGQPRPSRINVTGVYKKLYVAQSLKVMAQALPAARPSRCF
jgi:hypothetical protein